MTWVKLPIQDQWQNALDANASGFVFKTYEVGTTTSTPMAIDQNGSTTVPTVTLNADGIPEVSGNEVTLYINGNFRFSIYENATDASNDANAFYGPVDVYNVLGDVVSVATYAAARALDSSVLADGQKISIEGFPYDWEVKTGTATDNGWHLVFTDNSNRYAESTSPIYYSDIFGMLGDGSTDNSSLFTAAISHINANGGGQLFIRLQSSWYEFASGVTIDVDAPITITGEAGGGDPGKGVRLRFDGVTAGNAILIENSGSHKRGVTLERFSIYRSTLATKGGGSVGLALRAVKFSNFEQLWIQNFDTNCDIDDNSFDACFRNHFKNVQFANAATYPCRIGGMVENTFYGCRFGSSGGSGGHDYNCFIEPGAVSKTPNGNQFNDCVFIDSGTTNPINALRVTTGFFNTFNQCAFEQATDATVRFEYATLGTHKRIDATLNNCWIDLGATRGIDIVRANVHVVGGTRVDPVTATAETIRIVGTAATKMNTVIQGCSIMYYAVGGITVAAADGVIIDDNTFTGDSTNPSIDIKATCTGTRVGINTEHDTTGIVDLGVDSIIAGTGNFLKIENWPSIQTLRFSGTLDGSGNVTFAHGVATGQQKLMSAHGYYKGASGESVPLTLAFCDGANIRFTGGTATTAYRAFAIFAEDAISW